MLLGKSGVRAWTSQRLTRPDSVGSSPATVPARPALTIAALARAKRTQLEALMAAGVAVSINVEMEGATRLASLLPIREHVPGAAARRGVRRVFTQLLPQSLDVVVEKRWARR